MNHQIQGRCLELMDELMTRPCASVFLNPIDAESNPAYQSIKHPVDLTTIRTNLKDGKYKDVSQWESDMRHIWSNAEKLNKKDILACVLARELKRQFRKSYKYKRLYTVHKWANEASRLKDQLDYLLDTPPVQLEQYATISVQEDSDFMRAFSEREKSALGRATMYMTSPQDQKRVNALLLKYKTPTIKCDGITKVDLNSMSNQEMHELRALIEKRLADMHIPYPR